MRLKQIAVLGAFITAIIGTAVQASLPITTENCWIRPSTGPNTAAYLTITNSAEQPEKLIKVECEHCNSVELHNNIEENGIMKMRPVEFIEIGKDPVFLKPGGLHIMLMGLKDSFQGKEIIPLTLHFEKAGKVTLNFPVKVPESTEATPAA